MGIRRWLTKRKDEKGYSKAKKKAQRKMRKEGRKIAKQYKVKRKFL